jgi:son of sevenless-like protein
LDLSGAGFVVNYFLHVPPSFQLAMSVTYPKPHQASLHLSTDSYALSTVDTEYPLSPSSITTRATVAPSLASSVYSGAFVVTRSVLCLHDFETDDPDQLSFSRNEILEVVQQEDSGWWAAMRRNGDKVGWIPKSFVESLSKTMTEKLRHVREELRVFEYEAESLYDSAPISQFDHLSYPSPSSEGDDQVAWREGDRVRALTCHLVY